MYVCVCIEKWIKAFSTFYSIEHLEIFLKAINYTMYFHTLSIYFENPFDFVNAFIFSVCQKFIKTFVLTP